MEVERLVRNLRLAISESYETLNNKAKIRIHFDRLDACPIQLNKGRTVATVAKMLRDAGEEQVAGVLVQMFGSGEPYEVQE